METRVKRATTLFRQSANLAVFAASLAMGAVFVISSTVAAEVRDAHAASLMGAVKHGPDFKHFDWVNPDAPKGGTLRQFAIGTFDSLNAFSFKGQKAANLGLIDDALFASSPDEPTAHYGLIAASMSHPADYSSVTFKLRPEARWHDGKPITADDVVFSIGALKSAHPQYATYWKNVVKAEALGPHEVKFSFDVTGNKELPHIAGELTVLPKHWWTAKGPDGETRDITKTMSEIPLGSGPYKIKSVDMTRDIVYERVKDYWAKDLPVAKGQWNFDEIRYTYFRDRTPAFEEFKAGKIDSWPENRALAWATQYDFDAVKNGHVKKEQLPQGRLAGMQSFVFNLRRERFQDSRVRRALNLIFNFEDLNKTRFYGQYVRTSSFFEGSTMAARGLPTGLELEILATVKDKVPAEVFTTEWRNPVNSPETRRATLAEAMKLLTAAGWTAQGGVLKNAKGEEFAIEFLDDDDSFHPVFLPFAEELKLLGIKATVRRVDPPQFKARRDEFDFDAIVQSFGQSHSPGNEQREVWGSAAAAVKGGRNMAGIKDPAVDALVERVIFAKDREELVAATRALDRVLLWNHYVLPQWHYPYDRLASWDIFGRPEKLPSQLPADWRTWWVDPAKKAAIDAVRGR
jgi:microcin C transport system substrate-binding protein